jgi:hypothetical protein
MKNVPANEPGNMFTLGKFLNANDTLINISIIPDITSLGSNFSCKFDLFFPAFLPFSLSSEALVGLLNVVKSFNYFLSFRVILAGTVS